MAFEYETLELQVTKLASLCLGIEVSKTSKGIQMKQGGDHASHYARTRSALSTQRSAFKDLG